MRKRNFRVHQWAPCLIFLVIISCKQQTYRTIERPAGRGYHAMAYDESAGRIIIYGRADEGTDEMWAFDLNKKTWLELRTETKPGKISHMPMVCASDLAKVVLSGGKRDLHRYIYSDFTWSYDLESGIWPDVTVRKGKYFGQKKPGTIPEIFAPGFISTEFRDHSDLLFLPGEGEVYWSVVVDRNNGGILHTKLENSQWTQPNYASFSSSKDGDCIPTYWASKKRLFFSSRRPLEENDPSSDYNIWSVDRIGDDWSEPIPLNLSINGPKHDSNPAITEDGTLYFSSNRDGEEWYSYDIYKCEFINGVFSRPEPLGQSINTEYGEIVTFVAPDESYLIFTSFGRPDGHPNGDIFISFKNEGGQWIKAQSMGETINSGKGAGGGYVSSDGKYFFFINENEGTGDVYWVDASIIDGLKQQAEIQTDVYVKGRLKINAGYRCGRYVPETEVINEWWFGRNKVTFITTGWNLEWMSTDWRLTLDRERKRIIAVNLTDRTFLEVPIPMDPPCHIDRGDIKRLETVRIDGAIRKLDTEKVVLEKRCDIYEIHEWITAFDRFYDRERRSLAALDVPFDWRLVSDLFMWIRSFFNLNESYVSELTKLKGFILEEEAIFYQLGGQPIEWAFKVSEMTQKPSPPGIYDIPGSEFIKRDKFTYTDLVFMRRVLYPRPLF